MAWVHDIGREGKAVPHDEWMELSENKRMMGTIPANGDYWINTAQICLFA
jgi:hypothetical protein